MSIVGLIILASIIPVTRLIDIFVLSFIFKIVSILSLLALLIVEVILTGVNIFKVISHFKIDILNILSCFSAFIFLIVKFVILLSAS